MLSIKRQTATMDIHCKNRIRHTSSGPSKLHVAGAVSSL